MRLLLDTHAFLWWFSADSRLSDNAQSAIEDEANDVLISAASVWEIATKYRLGKLSEADELVCDIAGYMVDQKFSELSITLEHALRAGSLPGPHSDPFDRMLIAQAITDELTLVSNETAFDSYGVWRMW